MNPQYQKVLRTLRFRGNNIYSQNIKCKWYLVKIRDTQ